MRIPAVDIWTIRETAVQYCINRHTIQIFIYYYFQLIFIYYCSIINLSFIKVWLIYEKNR